MIDRSCFLFIFIAATAVFAAGPASEPAKVASPAIPAQAFDLTTFGGVGDGKTLNTRAFASAIDACSKAGGGVVVVPAGTFLTGRISLASNLELQLAEGSKVLLTDDTEAYRNERGGFDNCVTADDCHDVAITGSGTIDGQGQKWWDAFRKIKGTPDAKLPKNHRPYMITLSRCTRVKIQGVTLENSPSFHLVPQSCTDVVIDNVTFQAPSNAPNTDALDPSGWRYVISNCTFDVGDDCIAIKAAGKPAGDQLSCEDFAVSNCTFKHGHGLSVGGQTPGGLRRLTVRHCTFHGTDAGIRLKAGRGSGGLVEELSYDDIQMTNVKVPIYITSYYPTDPEKPADDSAQPITAQTPMWKNIVISHLTVSNCPEAGRLFGLPEMPLGSITIKDSSISSKKGFNVVNASDIKFENTKLTVAGGLAVRSANSTITGLP